MIGGPTVPQSSGSECMLVQGASPLPALQVLGLDVLAGSPAPEALVWKINLYRASGG